MCVAGLDWEVLLKIRASTGELVGMLTAFDILKAKNWELMQEDAGA